jgi:hypothetical protein
MPTDRHCTHCQSALSYQGVKRLHEGNANFVLMSIMHCHVYLCKTCGHLEFFALIDAAEGGDDAGIALGIEKELNS